MGNVPEQHFSAQVGAATDLLAVSASASLSLGRWADRSVYAWGYNRSGQLGLGDANRKAPTRVQLPSTLPGIYILLKGN